MATMKDIARLAKVSTSTVSHVINNTRFVSEEIKQKVMKVVDELNYSPSTLARSLKIKQTQTIGMLVTATNNPFFAEVMAGVEQYCHQHHYNLILATTDGDELRLKQNIQTLLQKQVDGLLLMCSDTYFPVSMQLKLSLPIVVMDWWFTELNADKILEDSELGGYIATKRLVEAGHRKIGIITGSLNKSLAKNRLKGYQRALSQAEITLNTDWIIESHFDFSGGVDGMNRLLALTDRPTAVFACCDTIAVGVYHSAWQHSLSIPDDLSVIGYDDIELAKYLSPPLSTVHQPKVELGKLAVETLLKRIQTPTTDYKIHLLKPTLVNRQSVKNVNP